MNFPFRGVGLLLALGSSFLVFANPSGNQGVQSERFRLGVGVQRHSTYGVGRTFQGKIRVKTASSAVHPFGSLLGEGESEMKQRTELGVSASGFVPGWKGKEGFQRIPKLKVDGELGFRSRFLPTDVGEGMEFKAGYEKDEAMGLKAGGRVEGVYAVTSRYPDGVGISKSGNFMEFQVGLLAGGGKYGEKFRPRGGILLRGKGLQCAGLNRSEVSQLCLNENLELVTALVKGEVSVGIGGTYRQYLSNRQDRKFQPFLEVGPYGRAQFSSYGLKERSATEVGIQATGAAW